MSDRPHSVLVNHVRLDNGALIGIAPGCLSCAEFLCAEYWHIRCDCVPELGLEHCHPCSEEAGREVPWEDSRHARAAGVQGAAKLSGNPTGGVR